MCVAFRRQNGLISKSPPLRLSYQSTQSDMFGWAIASVDSEKVATVSMLKQNDLNVQSIDLFSLHKTTPPPSCAPSAFRGAATDVISPKHSKKEAYGLCTYSTVAFGPNRPQIDLSLTRITPICRAIKVDQIGPSKR